MGHADRAAAGASVLDALGQHLMHLAAQLQYLADSAPVPVLDGALGGPQQVTPDSLCGVLSALGGGGLGLGDGLLHLGASQQAVASVLG